MNNNLIKITVRDYQNEPYTFGVEYTGELNPNTKLKFITETPNNMVANGRIHSLAALFVEMFKIDRIPEQVRSNTNHFIGFMNDMTPYEIVWESVIMRKFIEQGATETVYKGSISDDITDDNVFDYLKEAK